MSTPWKTFGHERTKAVLERQIGASNLPHAYLFSGPDGSGKKFLALELAAKVLGTERPESHPDFLSLDQEEEYSVGQIRDFIARLALKPLAARKKIAIINNVHLLNVQGSNALLKTLEEPSPSTVIILVGNGQKLLPTIRSRCLILSLQPFTISQLQNFADSRKLKVSSEILKMSFGSPGLLVKLCADETLAKNRQQGIEQWQQLKKQGTAERLLAIGGLAEAETPELSNLIGSWLLAETQDLGAHPQNYNIVAALQDTAVALGTNQNRKSILQNLFLRV